MEKEEWSGIRRSRRLFYGFALLLFAYNLFVALSPASRGILGWETLLLHGSVSGLSNTTAKKLCKLWVASEPLTTTPARVYAGSDKADRSDATVVEKDNSADPEALQRILPITGFNAELVGKAVPPAPRVDQKKSLFASFTEAVMVASGVFRGARTESPPAAIQQLLVPAPRKRKVWATETHAGGAECGAVWQRQYALAHRAAMSKGRDLFEDPGQRFVIYDCSDSDQAEDKCGGLGDMLKGIVSTFAFALLSNRTFLIRSTTIEAAFQSSHIQWKIPVDVTTEVKFQRRHRVLHFPINDRVNATSLNGYNEDASSNANLFIEALQDPASVIIVRGNRGLMHNFLDPKQGAIVQQMNALGLHRPSQAFKCLIQYIIEPTPMVSSSIREYLDLIQAPDTFVVGIHIRTGDANMEPKNLGSKKGGKVLLRRHGRLFKCAEILSEHRPAGARRVLWFLASDSQQLKDEARAAFGPHVIVTDFQPTHFSHRYKSQKELEDSIQSTVGEWLLFSECDMHVFRESGWSTTATLLSPHSDTAYVFPRMKGKWYAENLENVCRPDRPRPLDEEAKTWSGI